MAYQLIRGRGPMIRVGVWVDGRQVRLVRYDAVPAEMCTRYCLDMGWLVGWLSGSGRIGGR